VIEDGKQTMEQSGPLNSSMMSITDSQVMDIASENATKVIPLLTNHPSNRAYAWNVAVLTAYSLGHIPLIYMWWRVAGELSDRDLLWSVRANLLGIKGTYSVKSRHNGKALISVSSSKEIVSPDSSPAA